MTQPGQHDFYAYADGEGRSHGHRIKAHSFEAAAVGYPELYTPPVDSDGDIRIFVSSRERGEEHCFRVDLSDGPAEPCG